MTKKKDEVVEIKPRLEEKIKLDWNNIKHRELWINHIRLSALIQLVNDFLPQVAGPLAPLMQEIVGAIVGQIHTDVWAETYKILPELENMEVSFYIAEGYFKNTEEEKK